MNTLITQGFVVKDVALNYKNNIKLSGLFDRSYDSAYASNNGGKVGATISARLQQRWVVNEGQALITQPILNQTVPITANHQFQVGMAWSSADDALAIEEVQDRLTKPAGQAMANKVDVVCAAEVHKTVYYSIGSYGTAITDDVTYTDGIAKLRNVGVPQDLVVVLDPKAQ